MPPSSMSKIMTAYVVFAALKRGDVKLDDTLPVSERAWRMQGSKMFVPLGDRVKVEDLLRGMIIQSGNDASVALAEAIGGSEEVFAQMMNREAKRLGMVNTNFTNATGLTGPNLYSTAQDLSLLVVALIRDFPEHYALYSQKDYRYNNITQANRNRLLWIDPTVDGVKTGFTENAGYCLITSARRGDRRLVSVVLGTASESARATESQKLLNWGFQFFDSVKLYSRNQPLLAPVSPGQRVATLKLEIDGKPYRELPVFALEAVPVAGIFGRAWDSLRLLFK
jgi:D-alanyl-D-alanine carboxypeptidase (penicillin-binding protein 5/6)